MPPHAHSDQRHLSQGTDHRHGHLSRKCSMFPDELNQAFLRMGARVARPLPVTYGLHEPGQHFCYRVLSVAGSGFLALADMKCAVGATPRKRKHARNALSS